MNVFVVFCHPYENSFCSKIKKQFLLGLQEAGHKCEVSDLYKMQFNENFSCDEYLRETYGKKHIKLSKDVKKEQMKIQAADVIVFMYPIFWTDAPAKLIGWFDRVWTNGFAYGSNMKMKKLKKALVMISTGKTIEELETDGQLDAMRTIMIGDRINYRAEDSEMIVFDGIRHSGSNEEEERIAKFLW